MEKEIKKGTFHSHTIENHAQKAGVRVLTLTFLVNGGVDGVTQVKIQSPKYLEALAKTEAYNGVQTLEDVAKRVEELGTVDLYYNESKDFVGYSLTDSMYISTKNHVVNKAGTSKIIEVEHDDKTIVLYLEDGTIVRRNFSVKLGEEYFPDASKRMRLLKNMGISGNLETFDLDTLVGGTVEYLLVKSQYGDYFSLENYKSAVALGSSEVVNADEDIDAQLDALFGSAGQ